MLLNTDPNAKNQNYLFKLLIKIKNNEKFS
jgi:hypothetical protein